MFLRSVSRHGAGFVALLGSIFVLVSCVFFVLKTNTPTELLAQSGHRTRIISQRQQLFSNQPDVLFPPRPTQSLRMPHKNHRSQLLNREWATTSVVSPASWPPYYASYSVGKSEPIAVDHINYWRKAQPVQGCISDCYDPQTGVLESINKLLDYVNGTRYARYSAREARRERDAQLLEAIRAKLASLSPESNGDYYCLSTPDCPYCDAISDELDCVIKQGMWMPVKRYIRAYQNVVLDSEAQMRADLENLIAAYGALVMPEDPLPSDYRYNGDEDAATGAPELSEVEHSHATMPGDEATVAAADIAAVN